MLFVLAAGMSATVMAQLPKVYVTSNITTNTTWTNDHIYVLSGYIYVTSGHTLTINPGTVVYGNDPTLFSKGALIVTRGAKLMAVGTACQPVVFTSGTPNPKQRKRGDWGGVILLGKAQINVPGDTANIEGIPPTKLTLYGGGATPKLNDNSGTLQYVRIEYAGVALSPNNEINGLTLGGVGRGTTIDHVQVSYSNDDSYEWFGGNVNAKYLIAFRGIDDDFDTDQGFSGMVQFGVALRDSKVADVSKSHGFESDNDANGSSNTPQTKAIFCNITEDAGGDTTQNSLFEAGVYIRRNSALKVYNSIVMGWPIGIYIDGTASQNNVLADTLVNNNIIGVKNVANYVSTVSPSANTAVIDLLQNHAGNRFYTDNAGIKLSKPYNLNAPDLRPKASSPAVTGGNFNHAALKNAFFTKTSYVGALSGALADDWTKDSWVNWRPDTTNYSNGIPSCSGFVAAAQPISEDVIVADVTLSPNPSNGYFNIKASGFSANIINVKVSDLNNGKVYFIGKANNNSTTNISMHVPIGNYVVELSDGKTIVTKKLAVLN